MIRIQFFGPGRSKPERVSGGTVPWNGKMVDVRKAFAEFREASVRRQEVSPEDCFFDSSVPNRSLVQKRLSVYNWNPGPRCGKEGAIETRIAGKWHIITLQESIEYPRAPGEQVPRNSLRVMCSVIQQGYFFPDVKVKSIYHHDSRREMPDKIMEGDFNGAVWRRDNSNNMSII